LPISGKPEIGGPSRNDSFFGFLALSATRRYNPARYAAPGTPGGLPRSRAAEKAAFCIGLEHDPEKWEPVFGKDHAQTKC
jgi:hypothetical protein